MWVKISLTESATSAPIPSPGIKVTVYLPAKSKWDVYVAAQPAHHRTWQGSDRRQRSAEDLSSLLTHPLSLSSHRPGDHTLRQSQHPRAETDVCFLPFTSTYRSDRPGRGGLEEAGGLLEGGTKHCFEREARWMGRRWWSLRTVARVMSWLVCCRNSGTRNRIYSAVGRCHRLFCSSVAQSQQRHDNGTRQAMGRSAKLMKRPVSIALKSTAFKI